MKIRETITCESCNATIIPATLQAERDSTHEDLKLLAKRFVELFNTAYDASMSSPGTPPWRNLEGLIQTLIPINNAATRIIDDDRPSIVSRFPR